MWEVFICSDSFISQLLMQVVSIQMMPFQESRTTRDFIFYIICRWAASNFYFCSLRSSMDCHDFCRNVHSCALSCEGLHEAPQSFTDSIVFGSNIADHLLRELQGLVGGPEVFENFFRSYVQEFQGMTLTSNDFKTFFLSYFSETVPAVADIDWDTWFYGTGAFIGW